MSKASIAITPRNLNNMLEVIDLALKVVETHSKFKDAYALDIRLVKKKTNLGKETPYLANECLLSHRFDEAAKLLWVYCQDRTTCDIILFKGIMTVLENIQLSDADEIVMKFCSSIQRFVHLNKLDVQLEYILYALKNNVLDIQESVKSVVPSNWMKSNAKKIPHIEHALKAYCALLSYIAWRSCYADEMFPGVKSIADKAVADLRSVIDTPGIWDIFVLKLIEILEEYGNYEEIEDVLKKYVELNPDHINAYVYLCVHLHKHSSDIEEFIHYSKVLSKLCPSDIRVLLLVQTWDKLGKELKKRLKVLFMFLDYPSNGKNTLAWQMLASHLSQVVSSKKLNIMDTVKSSWDLRNHVWKYMHFNPANIHSDVEDNSEIVAYKVKVLSVLEPDHKYRKKALKKFSHLLRLDTTNSEKVVSRTANYENIYRLDDVNLDHVNIGECL